MQAQPLPPLPALKQLIDELADRMAQHLKARQGFLAAGNRVAALQGLGSFATAVLGACVSFHPLRGLGVAIAVLGAIITTLSGLSRVCNFAGRAAQNDDAVMYYSEGLYMAQRRFASFSRSNAPDPDEVMQVCVDASNFLDPDSPAGYKYEAEGRAGWAYIPLCCTICI